MALAGVLGIRLHLRTEAEAVARQLADTMERVEEEFGDKPEFRRDLAWAYLEAADQLHEIARYIAARDLADRSARLAGKHYAALAADPQAPDGDRSGLAQALNLVGEADRRKGLLEDSEKAYRRAIGIWEDLIQRSPDTGRYHEGLSWVCLHQAELAAALGRREEARDAYLRSVREGELALEQSPESGFKWTLPHIYRNMGAFVGGPDSEKALRRAAQLFDELAVVEPNSALVHHFHADTWRLVGLLLARARRHDEAELAYRRAVELHEKTLAQLPPGTPLHDPGGLLASFTDLAAFLCDRDQRVEAERILAHGRELVEQLPQFQDSKDAGLYNSLAWHLSSDRRLPVREPAVAVRLARKAVELAPESANIRNTLGVALYRAGDWASAIEELTRSKELEKRDSAFNSFFLAMAHRQLDHQKEAHRWYELGVHWMEKNAPRNEELLRFRAEAAELLGTEDPSTREADAERPEP